MNTKSVNKVIKHQEHTDLVMNWKIDGEHLQRKSYYRSDTPQIRQCIIKGVYNLEQKPLFPRLYNRNRWMSELLIHEFLQEQPVHVNDHNLWLQGTSSKSWYCSELHWVVVSSSMITRIHTLDKNMVSVLMGSPGWRHLISLCVVH